MTFINKLILSRIILTLLVIALLIFPFDTAGISTTKLFINESIVVDIKYLVAGVLFCFASITIIMFYKENKKKNLLVKDKVLNEAANKVLINSILVTLSSQGFIAPIIPIIIIIRDTIMSSFKSNFTIKKNILTIQNICMILGIMLTLFYNLPFELLNLRISEFLLITGAVLSIISAFDYYYQLKNKN